MFVEIFYSCENVAEETSVRLKSDHQKILRFSGFHKNISHDRLHANALALRTQRLLKAPSFSFLHMHTLLPDSGRL